MGKQQKELQYEDGQIEFFMFTVKGLEKFAKVWSLVMLRFCPIKSSDNKIETEQVLKPSSTRILPGIFITKFNEISSIKQMKTLRSVSKIIFLIGKLHDLPWEQSNIVNYLNDHVLSSNS